MKELFLGRKEREDTGIITTDCEREDMYSYCVLINIAFHCVEVTQFDGNLCALKVARFNWNALLHKLGGEQTKF